jgi:hypothetical protein
VLIQKVKIFIPNIILVYFLSTSGLNAQILRESSSVNLVKNCIDLVYNFQFQDADKIYDNIRQVYPGHPVDLLLKGMKTYWENFPLLPTSPARASFEDDLRGCIDLCQKEHNQGDEAEYLLANLCARGFLLMFYSDNDLSLEVFPLATSSYQYIRRSFDFNSEYSDFDYFTGLYDYLREAFPKAYPIYKPLVLLFPRGDKIKGIKELQNAAKKSILLRAESLASLSEIFIDFENNSQQSTYYSKILFTLYPHNPEYKVEYIRNLLLIKNYDEAERLILSHDSLINNTFFNAELTVFKGILKEKKENDYKQAHELYLKGASDLTHFGRYGNEFEAYAYFGLSRISGAGGEKNLKKLYRRLAIKLAESKKINFD